MTKHDDGPVPAIRIGDLKIFSNTREISEVEEDLLIKTHKLNSRQMKCIKKDLGVLRNEDNYTSYDVKKVIEFWVKH